MADAKSTEFKPAQGDLPNTFARFGIDNMKTTIKNWSDNNLGSFITIVSCICFFFLYNITQEQEDIEERQEDHLSQFTDRISSMKTTLEKSELSVSQVGRFQRLKADADMVHLSKREQEEYLGRTGVASISREEMHLKILAPDLDIVDPDS